MTLKVGDKVRHRRYDLTGTVVADRQCGLWDVKMVGVTGPSSVTPGAGTYWASDLKKIEDPAPKFKVGDRATSCFGGDVVTITKVGTTYGPRTYRAQYEAGDFGIWRESELTKIEQSVPFFLRNGDIVVNRKTGRKGEVIRGMVYDVNDTFHPTCKGVPAAAIEEYEDWHPGTYDLIKKDAPW